MLEYPESHTIARQMRASIMGKRIAGGAYINPNANIFNPEGAPDRYPCAIGGVVSEVVYHAPDLYIALDNGYGILFRQGGGKIGYHASPSDEPKKVHFRFPFSDGSGLTYAVRLWSYGVDVIDHGAWAARMQRAGEARYQPLGGSFLTYMDFVKRHMDDPKQPAKVYLAKHIAGIMSTFAGEILLYAQVHPATHIGKLDGNAHERVYAAMTHVLTEACEAGGRTSEVDLFGNPGGYRAFSERKQIGAPCPSCGHPLEKVSVGGVIAFCPRCQVK